MKEKRREGGEWPISGGSNYYYSFIIMGKQDNPLFEVTFVGGKLPALNLPSSSSSSSSQEIDMSEHTNWQEGNSTAT